MKKLKLPKKIIKKWLLITLCGLLALATAGYVWWSIASWGGYEKRYSQKQQDIQQKFDSVWSLPADTVEQKQVKLASLAGASAEIDKLAPDFCKPSTLVAWQRYIHANATRERECMVIIKDAENFSAMVRPAVVFLQQAQGISKALAAAPSQAEAPEGDFDAQLGAWRSVLSSVKGATASGKFEIVKQSTESSVDAIIRAWEEVIAAHAAKDKARYTKAVQGLAAAYDGLGEVSKVHTEQLNLLLDEIKK